MWDVYLDRLTANLEEMNSAAATAGRPDIQERLSATLATFNGVLGNIKNEQGDKLELMFVLHQSDEFDQAYEDLKHGDTEDWQEESVRLARFFLTGLEAAEHNSGWGAILILCRFKELVCRKFERARSTSDVKQVPRSAFVYAMQ